jgi:hypothetical protein
MTFLTFGGACAPTIVDDRPDARRITPAPATNNLIRLFGLDRLPLGRRLTCRWHRQPDGRLAAIWEPDISPSSAALTTQTQNLLRSE